jgi:hypothetical protein
MANILDRIAKILELADGAATDAEREQALAMAEKLMSAHKIDEAAARALNVAKGMADATQNVVTDKKIQFVPEWDEFRPIFEDCVGVLARLCGVRLVFANYDKVWLVGYQRDIDYFQMLWTSTHLAFSGKLFPEWNRGASPQRQIRAWVEAGYKWDYIWRKAQENGQPFVRTVKGVESEVPCPPADNGWMKRMLKKAYAETGEEKPQLTHGVKNYRHSYAMGFGAAFADRVWSMIWDRQAAERNASGGAQLVLAKDVDAIQAYFDKLFPPGQLGRGRRRELKGNHSGAAAAGGAAARNADLSGGSGGISGRRAAGALGS